MVNLKNLSINENHFPQNELTFDEFEDQNQNLQIKNLTVQLEFVAIRHPDYMKNLKCDIESYRILNNVLKNFPNLVSLIILSQFKMVTYSSDLEQLSNNIEYL